MYSVKAINSFLRQDVLQTAHFFTHRLEEFIAPLLSTLDKLLDKRLVYTFQGLCKSLLRLRNRSTSLVLSELGSYLLSPDKAPAGTKKRISNLLRSRKWQDQVIVDYLAGKAQAYAQELLDKKEPVLMRWDESVQSELGIESCRLWFWDYRMKLLQIVTLVYAFLLSLLEREQEEKIKTLLRYGCHRTGKRCKETPTPLYRIRLALTNLLNLYSMASLSNSG